MWSNQWEMILGPRVLFFWHYHGHTHTHTSCWCRRRTRRSQASPLVDRKQLCLVVGDPPKLPPALLDFGIYYLLYVDNHVQQSPEIPRHSWQLASCTLVALINSKYKSSAIITRDLQSSCCFSPRKWSTTLQRDVWKGTTLVQTGFH